MSYALHANAPQFMHHGVGRGKCLAARVSLNKLTTYEWIKSCTTLHTPDVYHIGVTPGELLREHWAKPVPPHFVIKPVAGSRGDGVRVLTRGSGERECWQDTLGNTWSQQSLVGELLVEAGLRGTRWFTEQLILPHESQKPFLDLPLTTMVLRYWFYDGRFVGGVWMAPHRGSEGKVIFDKGVRWGWFNYEGVMTPICGQEHIYSNDCIINGRDYTGYKIVGAGGAIVPVLANIAAIWKPGGTLRIDGFVNPQEEWVFGEIETVQRAPTTSGNARHMKRLRGLAP